MKGNKRTAGMKAEEIYLMARESFDKVISNSSQADIQGAINGFGIAAYRFAMRYTSPDENQELYNKIYNIFYDYFNNLKEVSYGECN